MITKRPIIITGLDIGSSKVSAVAAETDRKGLFRILAQVTYPSKGVSRGTVEDLDEAVASVSKVLGKLADKASRRIDNIYVNINGTSVRGERSKGMIPISLRGREVTRPDMERCASVASTINLPLDREILHRIVHMYSIDDQPYIKNPIGLSASRLACEVYILTANINHIQNIYKCVSSAGYDVRELVYTGIADGSSVLDPEDMESGAALVDIGSSITEISLFLGGVLDDIEIISFGARDIQSDFKDSPELAGAVSGIDSRLQGFLRRGGRLNSITIMGGMTLADGFIEFLEEKLKYPVKVGTVRGITGDISSLDSIKAATAIGLARYGYESLKEKAVAEKNVVKLLSDKVVDIFNNYF
ncbi:MAG: cell division protein FtsA [bacterium]|nr:cell division protein FtsA [bacterium]